MFLTPQAQDAFSRYTAGLFDERTISSVETGFQAFFGNPAGGGLTHYSPDANLVDIDIVRGNKRTAALIPRGMVSRSLGANQKNLQTGAFTSFSRKYPLAEEEGDITGDEILFRQPGESPASQMTRLDRMRDRAYKIHMESIRRTVRLFERCAAASVLTGFQPAILNTVDPDLMYDFRRAATHTWAPLNNWDAVGADILGDIDASCDLLEANGNADPDFIGIGVDAMDALVKDATVQQLADNRRFEMVEVSTQNPVPPNLERFVKAGWIARGRLRTPRGHNLWMFNYNRTYQNEAGVSTRYLPADQAFVCSTRARCDRFFGPPESLPMVSQRVQLYQELFGFNPLAPPMPQNILDNGAIVLPSMFYCDAYVSADWKKVTVRTQSAPIFATTQTDAFVTMTGLV
jgi:hypothetical protein